MKGRELLMNMFKGLSEKLLMPPSFPVVWPVIPLIHYKKYYLFIIFYKLNRYCSKIFLQNPTVKRWYSYTLDPSL